MPDDGRNQQRSIWYEEELSRIAMKDYLRVCEEYSYEKQITKVLAIISAEEQWAGKAVLQ